LCLIAVFAQPADAQKRSEKEADGFIGPVKNVYTTTAYVAGESSGPSQEMPALSHSFTYDDKGRLLEDAEILPDGSPDIRRTWKYDSRGNEIEHAYFVHDNLVFRTLKAYDAEGRETRSVEYGSGDSVRSKTRSTYRFKGRLREVKLNEPDGTLRRKALIKYDRRGQMIERREYEVNGILGHRYVFSYDVNGNKTEEIDYYRDERHLPRISKETLTYDAKNRLIAEAVYLRGSLSSKKVSTFDDKGNVIEQIKYDGKGSIEEKSTISYVEFDSRENWIKAILKTSAANKESPLNRTMIMRRTISYFAGPTIAETH